MNIERESPDENVFLKAEVILRKFNSHLQYYKMELLSKSESVKFLLIESVICIFTESPVNEIFFSVKSVNFH